MSIRVKTHSRRSRKGKRFNVRQHSRTGKSKAVARINKMHPGISRKQASQLFDMSFDSLKQDVKTKGRVSVPGFGTFRMKRTRARGRRMVRNPSTGQMMMGKAKPARMRIKFRKSTKW